MFRKQLCLEQENQNLKTNTLFVYFNDSICIHSSFKNSTCKGQTYVCRLPEPLFKTLFSSSKTQCRQPVNIRFLSGVKNVIVYATIIL